MELLIKKCLTLVFGLFVAISAGAHGDMDKIFDSIEAPHGGRIRESGGYQIELVARQNVINVYVTNVDNKYQLDLSAFSAAVIIAHEGKKEVLDLEYKDGALTAQSQFSSLELATVAVVIKSVDGKQLSAKFLPKSSHH